MEEKVVAPLKDGYGSHWPREIDWDLMRRLEERWIDLRVPENARWAIVKCLFAIAQLQDPLRATTFSDRDRLRSRMSSARIASTPRSSERAHSARNASSGEIELARNAGIRDAMSADNPSVRAAIEITGKLYGLIPYSWRPKNCPAATVSGRPTISPRRMSA